jgi:hypothetical protein
MMHSGKQCGEIQCLLASEDAEDAIIMAANIMGEPQNIYNTLSLPGDEGEAWEHACQAEWQNMVNHDIFGPPDCPPPNTHILKMGTALCTSRKMVKLLNERFK